MRILFVTICILFTTYSYACDYKNVLVLADSTGNIKGDYLGEIKFSESGFTSNCSYPEVIDNLKQQALQKNANLMLITRHKKPDAWSSCHRITASLYMVADTKPYESDIIWTSDRKLGWDDFKCKPPTEYGLDAESYCSLSYTTNNIGLFNKIKYYITVTFVPEKSWATNRGKKSTELLNHEQSHFNLWEIYARKFHKELQNKKRFQRSLAGVNELLNDLYTECMRQQLLYDMESNHGTIKSEQAKWDKIIADELVVLQPYANHY